MLTIKSKLEFDENILYKPKKRKWIIILFLLMLPMSIVLIIFIVLPCFKNIFGGSISFDSNNEYIMTIMFLLGFYPIILLMPLSYMLNTLIITNKRVLIRKGILGKLIILNINDIISYKKIMSSSRGIDNYFLGFCIRDGSYTKTGNLFISKDSFSELINVLQ